MSDTVTILSSSTGHSLSKAFIGESYVSNKFNPGTTFTASQVTVKDLDSLADLLRSLEAEPTKTIIRGKSISDATGVVTRPKDQFKPAKRQWCMIDIDSLEWGVDIHLLRHKQKIKLLITRSYGFRSASVPNPVP